MRRQHAGPVPRDPGEGPPVVGQGVQRVRVQDEGLLHVRDQLQHQTPGRTIPAQPGPDQAHARRLQVPHDRGLGRVSDGAGGDLLDRGRHDLRALGGQHGVDPLGHDEAHDAGSRAGGRRRAEIRGPREAQAARDGEHRAEGAFVRVGRSLREPDRLGRRERQLGRLRHLQHGGGDRDPLRVGDADLHLRRLRVTAQQAHSGRAAGGVVFESLDGYLHQAGLASVVRRQVSVPIGHWGGQVGSLMVTDLRAGFTRVCEVLRARSSLTAEEGRDLVRLGQEEWEHGRMSWTFAIAFGRKP